MTAEPVVSVVMPTFDRLEFLPAAVESVRRQTFAQWELIVADDGSGAEVLDYLATLEADERVRVLRLAHSGNAGRARNCAITAARGALIAFLDSDDLWEPMKLERQLAAMSAAPAAGWSYTAFVLVDAQNRPLASERDRRWTPHGGWIFPQTVRTSASIILSAVVVRAPLLRGVGGFDEAIDCSEDYDLWMRLALSSPVCAVAEPLVRIRRDPGRAQRTPGSAHLARDYSLRKLAARVTGRERALLERERSRNAVARAAAIAARGGRWQSLEAIVASVPLGWRYPRWWYGTAKTIARACRPARRRHPAPPSAGPR